MQNSNLENLTLCIPTRDRLNFLRTCLERVQYSMPFCQVIISDNSQFQDITSLILEFSDLNIVYLPPVGDLSLYQNFDRCISAVKTDYCMLMGDDDLLGKQQFFDQALALFNKDTSLTMVAGRVLAAYDTEISNKFSNKRTAFAKNAPYTKNALLFWLPFPTITGCVFRTTSIRNHSFEAYEHRSADTSLLLEFLLRYKCSFIEATPVFMINHRGSDHLSLNLTEIKVDLSASWRHCLALGKQFGPSQSYTKIIYGFFAINRLISNFSARREIIQFLRGLPDFRLELMFVSAVLLLSKFFARRFTV